MEEKWAKYLHKHTRLVTTVVVVIFLFLAAGEYYLFRKIMYLNLIMSEGIMQIKEEIKQSNITPSPLPK